MKRGQKIRIGSDETEKLRLAIENIINTST